MNHKPVAISLILCEQIIVSYEVSLLIDRELIANRKFTVKKKGE